MLAIELFEKLGYKQVRNDDDYIIYEKEVGQGTLKVISFCDQLQDVNVSFEDDVPTRQVPGINIKLFKAIQQQFLELGWLDN